jgi:hypothetical protein
LVNKKIYRNLDWRILFDVTAEMSFIQEKYLKAISCAQARLPGAEPKEKKIRLQIKRHSNLGDDYPMAASAISN